MSLKDHSRILQVSGISEPGGTAAASRVFRFLTPPCFASEAGLLLPQVSFARQI